MTLFIACLIIYAHALSWQLYVIAVCVWVLHLVFSD